MTKLKLLSTLGCLLLLGMAPAEPLTENAKIQKMYEAAMKQRAQYGLPEQELDEELCEIAQRWANRMAAQNAMFHGGGEQIIAQGYPDEESCVRGWIYSAPHRAWVLSRNAKCGFGCQKGSDGRWYWAGVYR
jgi:uncharacterized protein YkwD